jgi:hypothetical protein
MVTMLLVLVIRHAGTPFDRQRVTRLCTAPHSSTYVYSFGPGFAAAGADPGTSSLCVVVHAEWMLSRLTSTCMPTFLQCVAPRQCTTWSAGACITSTSEADLGRWRAYDVNQHTLWQAHKSTSAPCSAAAHHVIDKQLLVVVQHSCGKNQCAHDTFCAALTWDMFTGACSAFLLLPANITIQACCCSCFLRLLLLF